MTHNYDPYGDAKELKNLTLGKTTGYSEIYDPNLLQGIPRTLNRHAINLDNHLPFHGTDIWTGYELSWLNSKGKPVVAIMECHLAHDTQNLIESKSFKLYLNSFNQTRFESLEKVQQILQQDLSSCAEGGVQIKIFEPKQFGQQYIVELPGHCIDDLNIEIDHYEFNPSYLKEAIEPNQIVAETLMSNLLKSNCLITSQPDWGSVMIRYQGPKINQEKLLRYLISFRQHNEFHEQCVERIFMDLKRLCKCSKLTVYARYTRRGGLDINPYRSDFEQAPENHRLARQ